VRRLRPLDAAVVLLLVPLWAVSFGLHLKEMLAGRLAWVPVFVSLAGGKDSYPSVSEFRSGARSGDPGLAVGDRLIRVGEAELRGVGPIGFAARVYAEAGPDLTVRTTYERAGVPGTAKVALIPMQHPWGIAPLVCVLAITGLLVFLRLPQVPIGRAFFLGAISFSTHWSLFGGGPPAQTYVWAGAFIATSLVMFPLCLRPALLFPEEIAPRGGRLPYWPWIFAVFGPFAASWVFATPFSQALGERGVYLTNVAFAGCYLWLLTRNYRRCEPIGRRQLKWVIYGFYLGMAPVLAIDLVTAVRPSLWWLHEVTPVALIPIPVCLLIAIMRYNLFDIDHLISLTAVYSFLSIVLLGAMMTVVPRLAAAASVTSGADPGLASLALSFLLAAGLVRAQRHLQPPVERFFFPERHWLQVGFETLLHELSICVTPQSMLTLGGERLSSLLRPEVCRIYGVDVAGEDCVLLFAGGVRPPAGPGAGMASGVARREASAGVAVTAGATGTASKSAGVMLKQLSTLTNPTSLVEPQTRGRGAMRATEGAVLASLGLDVVVPVRRLGKPAALICLGPKRSGDVYSSTDLTLLGALADKLSSELLRFDDAEILRQSRAMQEALRQYVPDPLVDLLASGGEVQGGERDVSILFVDLRSFTSYSEKHRSGIVFSVVNRYTEAVSAVIRAHDGTVVEFLGDGMMAVFGAPVTTPGHERAAVACACEIVVTVKNLHLGDPGADPIQVSVGIASGDAFVGNVRSADRLIYTAIGDTANLAARIENLTRRLGAAIAIDGTTRAAAGDAAAAFWAGFSWAC